MKAQDFIKAVQEGNTDRVLEGLRLGFGIHTVDTDNDTAFDIALSKGHSEIAALLLSPPTFEDAAPEQSKPSVDNGVEPLAVVGMSCRFAGHADNLNNFWTSLTDKTENTSTISINRFVSEVDYRSAKKYTASFLQRDIGSFDAEFFRINASEAHLMDPQ